MSVLKAAEVPTRGVRAWLESALPTPVPPTVVPVEGARLAELEEALRMADERAQACDDAAVQREQAAWARGRVEGEQAATARLEQTWDAQRDAFLRTIETCAAQVDRRFAELETFALDLAEAALGALVDDPSQRRSLLAETIARHVAPLAADTVMAIDVSAADIPDPAAFATSLPSALAARLRVTDTVGAGECRIALVSGAMDIGLHAQAARVAATVKRLRE